MAEKTPDKLVEKAAPSSNAAMECAQYYAGIIRPAFQKLETLIPAQKKDAKGRSSAPLLFLAIDEAGSLD
ncbi:hypothetical protein ACQY0O_006111 [Thecaphora frezii]